MSCQRLLACSLVLLAPAAPLAAAAGTTVTDQAVTLTLGASHWDGSPQANLLGTEPLASADVVYESGWWYRVEGLDTREHPFPAPTSESYTGTSIAVTWDDVDGKGFDAREFLEVFDGERPSGTFTSQLSLANNSGAAMTVKLFHFLDADANGTLGSDSATRLADELIAFGEAESAGLYRGRGIMAQRVGFMVRPGPQIKTLLNDESPATLDDSGLPFGPGDFTAAFEWTITLPTTTESAVAQVTVSSRVPGCSVKGDMLINNSSDILLCRTDTGLCWTWDMRRTSAYRWSGAAPDGWRRLATDDFTGDCEQDLVEMDASNRVWFYDFNSGPVPLSGGPILPANWKLTATADFDHDGRPDILWRNADSQRLVIWTMNGPAKSGNIIPTPDHAVDANWEVVAAVDMNADTHTDLLWYNTTSGRIVIWFMDASVARTSATFTTPMSAGGANWRVVAGADYGKGPAMPGAPVPVWGSPDLLWRNSSSGKLVVWHMDFAGRRTAGVFTTPDAPTPDPLAWQVVGPR